MDIRQPTLPWGPFPALLTFAVVAVLVVDVRAVPVSQLAVHWPAGPGQAALADQARQGAEAEGAGAASTVGYETVAICKANCIQETLYWPPSDKQCLEHEDCVTCWQECELLYNDEKRRSRCSEESCITGCRLACDFDFKAADTGFEGSGWYFPADPVTVEVNAERLSVSWRRPELVDAEVGVEEDRVRAPEGRTLPVFVVYTILYIDDNSAYWGKAVSTVELAADVTGEHGVLPGLRLLLVAASSFGTLAVARVPYPGVARTTEAPTPQPLPAKPSLPEWDPTIFTDNSEPPAPHRRNTGGALFESEEDIPGKLSAIVVEIEQTSDGKLRAHVTWKQELRQPLPLTYFVSWSLRTCNVNSQAPHCPLTEERVEARIEAKEGTVMRVILAEITYNSRYLLEVGFIGASPELLNFYTPLCSQPDATFTVCHVANPTGLSTVRPGGPAPTSLPTVPRQQSTKPDVLHNHNVVGSQTRAERDDRQDGINLEQLPKDKESSDQNITLVTLVVAMTVSISTVVVALAGYCLYKRFCNSPDRNEEAFKDVIRSYASLPLIMQHQASLLNSTNSPTPYWRSLEGIHRITTSGGIPLRTSGPEARRSLWSVSTPQMFTGTPLSPLSGTHMGISSVRQTPTVLPPGGEEWSSSEQSFSPAPATTGSAPRMGTRAMNITENPLCDPAFWNNMDPDQTHRLSLGQSRSVESLNRVSAGLGLPCATRKAASSGNLVLHALEPREDESKA